MLFDKIQLEPDEVVLKTVRKHWFIITVELLGVALMILLPFILLPIMNILPISFGNYFGVFVFGIATWTLFAVITGFTIWTHYYLDLWVITDRRIILIDQVSFFNRHVSIFRLERMQDIRYKINGIIPTLLNFGTLQAQTAGASESDFISTGLPDPRGLQAIIQQCMDNRLANISSEANEHLTVHR